MWLLVIIYAANLAACKSGLDGVGCKILHCTVDGHLKIDRQKTSNNLALLLVNALYILECRA